eukprot:CAMPEP_0196578182 /NCGR_PEP_ID=MMETSP1081-20130531/7131_1 /TAXON_ID=36882 /ORGANISM="Pyramimonas amylifera, Strain CCMP720" /LENGTH=605 /DNA_ID=CAMNT_0041897317 /DNA_START=222 /DNA_END=2039 /DNA_ORIENTATION=+
MNNMSFQGYSGLHCFTGFYRVIAASSKPLNFRCNRGLHSAPINSLTWPSTTLAKKGANPIWTNSQNLYAASSLHFRSLKTNAAVDANALSSELKPKPSFSNLGLSQELLNAVESLGLFEPTEIQQLGIVEVLKGGNVLLASQTGSGKTLSYMLPLIEQLRREEVEGGVQARNKRPRALVVLPTRELTQQVLAVSKSLCHFARFRSTSIIGGGPWAPQTRALERPQDLVVCTPGRLLQHVEKGTVLLSDLRYLVLDEADTMFDAGFGAEIRSLLAPLRSKPGHQVIMVAATITKPVRRLLEEALPDMRDVRASSTHKANELCTHSFVRVPGTESKLEHLRQVVNRDVKSGKRTMIFCNTVDSCRAVEHYMQENGYSTLCYHGDMPKEVRAESFAAFLAGGRKIESEAPASGGAVAVSGTPLLVCTDLAARGLDIGRGGVDHVVNFDFPTNPVDYMHRSGRTARAGSKGRVSSLVGKRDETLAHELHKQIQAGGDLDEVKSSKKEIFVQKERDLKQRRANEYKLALRTVRRQGGEIVKAKKGTGVMVVPKKSKSKNGGKFGKFEDTSKKRADGGIGASKYKSNVKGKEGSFSSAKSGGRASLRRKTR